jgi:hypothetical protein
VLYVGADSPLEPRIVESLGPSRARIGVEAIPTPARARRLSDDQLEAAELLRAPNLVRIELNVNDGGAEATSVIDLGAQPSVVWATGTADRVAAPRVRACRRITVPASPSRH